jgi:hypothetical protein
MNTYWTYIALDIANERAREADRHRLAAIARAGAPARDRSLRHAAALAAAAVTRLSAGLVRRLDGCVADDLAHSFGAPASSTH